MSATSATGRKTPSAVIVTAPPKSSAKLRAALTPPNRNCCPARHFPATRCIAPATSALHAMVPSDHTTSNAPSNAAGLTGARAAASASMSSRTRASFAGLAATAETSSEARTSTSEDAAEMRAEREGRPRGGAVG